MDYFEKKIIKEDIFDIKIDNLEEVWVMARYCLFAYIKCLIAFGKDNKVTKDVKNVWMEFLGVIKEEKKILDTLLKCSSNIDYEEVDKFMVELDELNVDTLQYYYEVLDDIEDACDVRQEWKATRRKKYFDTLIETNKYKNKIYEFLLNEEDIVKFLGYPKEFFDYIDDRTYIVDSRFEEESCFYGVNMKMDGDILVDMKMFVPEIVNLETAMVNVHELKHAYDLYKVLGKKIDKDETFFEEEAKKLEDDFRSEYMPNIYKRTLKKNYNYK